MEKSCSEQKRRIILGHPGKDSQSHSEVVVDGEDPENLWLSWEGCRAVFMEGALDQKPLLVRPTLYDFPL